MTKTKLPLIFAALAGVATLVCCGDDADYEEPAPSFEGNYAAFDSKDKELGIVRIERLAITLELGDCEAAGRWEAGVKDSSFSFSLSALPKACKGVVPQEGSWRWAFGGDTLLLSDEKGLALSLVRLDSLPEKPGSCAVPEDTSVVSALEPDELTNGVIEAGECQWYSATVTAAADLLQWLDGHLLSTDTYARIALRVYDDDGKKLYDVDGAAQQREMDPGRILLRVGGEDSTQAGRYRVGLFARPDTTMSSEALSSSSEEISSSSSRAVVELVLDSLYDEVVFDEHDTIWFRAATKTDKQYTITCLDMYSAKVVGLYGSDVILDVFGSDRSTVIEEGLDFNGVSTAKFEATGSTTWIAVRMNLLNGFFGLMLTD